MPILPGDELSGDCQYVGNTPIQPHKADNGVLARATEADLDAAGEDVDVIRTGMVILSSRKQAYIDAYAALGLGVCDEDDAPFAAENAPLMIRFEAAGDLQVWLTGRDFVDYTGQNSDPEYWQLAFDSVVSYAASNVQAPRTHIVVLVDLTLPGGAALEIYANMFADCATKPGDWELRIFDDATPGSTSADYFAGSGVDALGNPSSPDETAVLIVSDVFTAGADTNGSVTTLVANAATIQALLAAKVGLIAWSQVFDADTVLSRGDPMAYGWSWLDGVFPGLYAVALNSYPAPYVPTDAGEAKIPGMADSINYPIIFPAVAIDTAQAAFAGDLNGLVALVYTQDTNGGLEPAGSYRVDIGGVPNL